MQLGNKSIFSFPVSVKAKQQNIVSKCLKFPKVGMKLKSALHQKRFDFSYERNEAESFNQLKKNTKILKQ